MSGQARRETPRWKQRRPPAPAGPVITVKGRGARQLARDIRTLQQPPAGREAAPGLLARTGAYRFRRHLIPVWLLAAITAAGLGCHHAHATAGGVVLAIIGAAAVFLLTRHLKGFGRRAGQAAAVLTAVWVPVLTLGGLARPWPALAFASWLPLMWAWARHYRWRPGDDRQEADATDVAIWGRLAARNKWQGHLGAMERLPGGGRQYPITLDGAETHIGQLLGEPRRIAAAWAKSVTEAYAEPSPDGVESRGMLTILPRSILQAPRGWDGAGVDPETGMAVVGRFADGTPMHHQYFSRRNGTVHALVAGTTGAGKSYLLNLLICAAVASGCFIPIVLDPQEGQSLPAWRRRVLYAAGADECMARLRGVHAGMLGRSRHLSTFSWTDDEGIAQDGCDFFDTFLTGLPVVLLILDEAPALLNHRKYGEEAAFLVGDIGKRGRKAGVSEILAAGVPSLAELRDQALRDMLAGGNVYGLRTASRVTQGMIGLGPGCDPWTLARFFADGTKTHGLCYAATPDNRSAPGRIDLVGNASKVAASASIPDMDSYFAEAMHEAMAAHGYQLTVPVAASGTPLAAVPSPEDDRPGRTAADAVLAVLGDAGRELDRGEIIIRCRKLATAEWGRKDGFGVRAIGDALSKLVAGDQIDKTGHGSYAPRRASLHAVSGSAATGNGAPR